MGFHVRIIEVWGEHFINLFQPTGGLFGNTVEMAIGHLVCCFLYPISKIKSWSRISAYLFSASSRHVATICNDSGADASLKLLDELKPMSLAVEAFVELAQLLLLSLVLLLSFLLLFVVFLELLIDILELLIRHSWARTWRFRASTDALSVLRSVGEARCGVRIDERVFEWVLPYAASSRGISWSSAVRHANIWNSCTSCQLLLRSQMRILVVMLLCVRVPWIRCKRSLTLRVTSTESRPTSSSSCIGGCLTTYVLMPVATAIHILATHFWILRLFEFN